MLLIILVTSLVALFYHFIVKPYNYWKDRGVNQGRTVWILGDNWKNVLRTDTLSNVFKNVYDKYPDARYAGMYLFFRPTLLLRDPDLIKQVTVKNFDHLTDHRTIIPEEADPLWGKNLFALKGQRWRDMRTILSPSFTTSKMRMMFVLMAECAENFVNHFLAKHQDVITVEMKDVCTRYASDVIATTAFGFKVDSMKEPNNEFYVMGRDATNFTDFFRFLKVLGYLLFPTVYRILKIKIFSNYVRKFFIDLVDSTIKVRETQGIVRLDMIHLLMEARKEMSQQQEDNSIIDTGFATALESDIVKPNNKIPHNITNADIASQALIFFFAGFDTVSNLMCFLTYELTVHPNIQERLRSEVFETLKECSGKLTYESLSKMKYMDMVVSEVLRKWPIAFVLDRVVTKPYTIEPKLDGEKPLCLEQGTLLAIPVYAIHRDAQYFPDPELFDPERFNDENKQNIKPYTYFPFGLGPRNCIGSRFALLETKAMCFYLLYNFQIVPVEKTVIPARICKKNFNLRIEDDLIIGLKRIKK